MVERRICVPICTPSWVTAPVPLEQAPVVKYLRPCRSPGQLSAHASLACASSLPELTFAFQLLQLRLLHRTQPFLVNKLL